MSLSVNNQPIRKMQLFLINFLVLVSPFHYLLFAVLLQNFSALKLWRDVVMILILLLEIIKDTGYKPSSAFFADAGFIILSIVYAFLAPALFPALNVLRVYLFPILIFHVAKNMVLTPEEISALLKRIIVSATICCLYGIFQAYILGPDFLVKLGYGTENGALSSSLFLSNYAGSTIGRNVQRVISTFASANMCGFYLSVVFILVQNLRKYIRLNKALYYGFAFLVIGTIVLTFSRSCWLALAVSLLLTNAKQTWQFIVKGWKPIAALLVIVIALIVGYAPLREALHHVITSSLSGSDTSVLSHFSTIDAALDVIKAAPLGLGLGTNGPRALNYGAANLVESSYLLMMFEFGIPGGLLYFYDYVYMAIHAFSNRHKAGKVSSLILCLVSFALIAYFNIPYVQELECTTLILLCLGFAYAAQNQQETAK